MDKVETSRRALIGALALAAPVGALALGQCAQPARASTSDRAAWNRAATRVEVTDEAHNAAIRIYDAAQQAYFDEKPVLPLGMTIEVGDTVDTYNGRCRSVRVDHEAAVAECRSKHRVDETDAAQVKAGVASMEAVNALIAMAAPDLAACAYKIEIGERFGMDISDLRVVVDEIRAFAAGGLN